MFNGVHTGMETGSWVPMVLLWLVLLALIAWFVARLFPTSAHARHDADEVSEAPRKILDRRLVSGEIDVQTHEALSAKLGPRPLAGTGVMTTRRNMRAGVLAVVALVAVVGAVVALAATSGTSSLNSGWQMMGARYVYRPAASTPVQTLSAARSDAQRLADRIGLRVDEVLQFKRNFYAKLVDGKGNGMTEVLVDPASGVVSLEYGPAMMWNTRYGMGAAGSSMMGSYGASMMGGQGANMMGSNSGGSAPTTGYGSGTMMGGSGYGGMMGGSVESGAPTPASSQASGAVSMADAHTFAQRWLDAKKTGAKVETGGDAFPGYYTLETLAAGRITGMISVNASTGAVWPHWWHGAFIAKS